MKALTQRFWQIIYMGELARVRDSGALLCRCAMLLTNFLCHPDNHQHPPFQTGATYLSVRYDDSTRRELGRIIIVRTSDTLSTPWFRGWLSGMTMFLNSELLSHFCVLWASFD